jgi:ABC-type branched-subunit amino acid transport system substrate-binding protein
MRAMRGRSWQALLVGVALVLAACGSNSSTANKNTQKGAINIGVIAPFTGPAAQFGKLLSAPCLAATYLINQEGGILGHQVNCASIDDTGDPADAVPNVTKAVATTSNLDMAIGLESNTAATTVPLVNNAKIPFFTTNGLVSFNKTTDQYYWRATAADNANGVAFAIWAAQKGLKKAAIVFQNNIGSEGNLPGVQSAYPKLGGTIVSNITIAGDAVSYSSEAERVIASKPDVLIFSADPQTSATFLSNYKQLNGGTLPPMVTATDSLTPDFYGAVSKAVGASYITNNVWLVGSYFDNTTAAFNTYKTGIFAVPQNQPFANVIITVGPPASAYDGINVMALAMIEAGTTIGKDYNSYINGVTQAKSGATVVHSYAEGKKALAAGKTIQYVGVVGPISFDKYHNFSGAFAANVFTSDGNSQQVGVIPGDQVQKLLG